MQLTDLIVYLLATTGLSITVTWSSIFEPFRNLFAVDKDVLRAHNNSLNPLRMHKKDRTKHFFHQLFTCPFCFGFWASFIIYGIIGTQMGYMLCLAFSGCTAAYAIYAKFFK